MLLQCKTLVAFSNPLGARWLTGRASDYSVDTRFDSPPGRFRVKTLGKFLTHSCNVVLYSII